MQATSKSFSAGTDSALEIMGDGLAIGGSRALVYSHVTIEMLRRQLFHQLGDELARSILAQAGRHAGFNDAQVALQTEAFARIDDAIAAQFAALAGSGFGRFELVELVCHVKKREIYVRVRCQGSSEAESHRRLFGVGASPACCHLVGYMAGWSSSVTGESLLTVESHCLAKGDDHCEFETLLYADFVGPEAAFWKSAFESTSRSLAQQLKEQLETTQRQMATISAQREDIAVLSTPVLQLAEDVLALPVVGRVDAQRAAVMSETLLQEVVAHRAFGVILDLTGLTAVDSSTVTHFIKLGRAIRMLGAHTVMTGISPETSQLLVGADIQLAEIVTQRSLEAGIRYLETIRRR